MRSVTLRRTVDARSLAVGGGVASQWWKALAREFEIGGVARLSTDVVWVNSHLQCIAPTSSDALYALIIAGGEGQRLRPHTYDRPKNMVPILGKPIVDWQLEWLREGGVTDAVLLCGYKAEVLKEHLGDGESSGLRVQYSLEDEPLGRGGALKRGASVLEDGSEPVVACNGDILTRQPLSEVIAYHKETSAMATVMLTSLRSPYGVVDVGEDGRIASFREKPELPYWINAGIYVFSREFFSLLPDKGDHETTTFPKLASEGRLYGYKSREYWRPVDSIKDLSEAEKELAG